MEAETQLTAEHTRFLAHQPTRLTAADRAAIERLAADVPAIWQAASTTAAERKEIVRLMLDRVVATVEGETENMEVECHWAGGRRTRHRLRRAVRRMTQLAGHDELLARTTALFTEGLRPPAIARTLAAEGLAHAAARLPKAACAPGCSAEACYRTAGTDQHWWWSGIRKRNGNVHERGGKSAHEGSGWGRA
ncbi:hypothetical protein M5E06_31650 [Azospirillum sp. A1-3]|uniref:hypothetical protein n=1 Tax=Azospirillum sp. A1-3 TaxID=185874 RepID=UPI0020770685|nr:hypothetical protein [Azospirillum sp. A1-3]MCM8738665.1 hypothetical protein [Azospirillum sp. A1-3]